MVYIGWTGKDQDDLFEAQGAWLIDKVKEYTVTVGADNEYIYLDYADEIQDPLGSYGADNVYKMRAVAQKYDPKGVFQRQVPGGFKISKVCGLDFP